jgi:hypothetical protein
MKLNFAETLSAIILIAILFLTTSSEMLLMPKNTDMMLVLGLIVSFLVFAAVWKETAADERENLHRLNAGRASFLIGSVVLVIGIAIQALDHNVDPWLVYALIAMVASKLASRIISQWRN